MPASLKANKDQNTDYVSQTFSVQVHNGHKRLREITLSKSVIHAFLEDAKTINVHSLEYIPFKRFVLADMLSKHAGSGFSETLNEIVHDRNSGGFTIGLGGFTSSENDYVKFGTAIGHLIGASNHDQMSNAYYARFVVKHADKSDSFLRQAYRLFTLHTDGTFVDEATDWLLMMKFSEKNCIGGESRILHLDDWTELEKFKSNPLGEYQLSRAE